MRARYRRYDGTQDPLGGELDVGDLLEEIGDDLLAGAGGAATLEQLRQRGFAGRAGLADIRRRVAAMRREAEREASANPGQFDAIAAGLQEVVDLERAALAERDEPDARFQEFQLDALPPDPAGRFRALQDHDFASPEAAARFEQLAEELRREVLDAYLRGASQAVDDLTPEQLGRIKDMLAELTAMIEARNRGEQVDFAGFMGRHGDLVPGDPQDLDELLEQMARRAAALSRMLASMTPAQRQQFDEISRRLLDDVDLSFQLAQLEMQLRDAWPTMDWDRILGEDVEPGHDPGGSAPFSQLVDLQERVGELKELERALGGDYAGATIEDVDEEAIRRHLGDDAVRDLQALKRIEDELERAGVMQRRDGELVLTPRGARLLGERALTKLLDRVRRDPRPAAVGADPEPTGQTRVWRFGDREPIAVQRTVTNAVLRQGPTRGGRVRLSPEDFEVVEHEVRPRTATALLLDLSFSMPLQGHFVPAKRMALALHALIEGKHRQDSLHLIGFSDYARRMQPVDLGAAGFERVYGTNMQHAFLLARRALMADPRPVKQVIMVTDGEPTAHLDDGEAIFNYPTSAETLERTLREAMRLARSAIAINIFLLEDSPGLVAFAERLSALTGGQVFQMSADETGRHVLAGYAR